METKVKKTEKFSQSIAAKAIVIGVITLLMLIPSAMIRGLISERETRSNEAIEGINEKWSKQQTITGPLICIPYTYIHYQNGKQNIEQHILNVAPNNLNIKGEIFPEEKHLGIYKTIVYQSKLSFDGDFEQINLEGINYTTMHWDKAYFAIGINDLKGVKSNLNLKVNDKTYNAEPGGDDNQTIDQGMIVKINDPALLSAGGKMVFSAKLDLDGSSKLQFIPVGKTTKVSLKGKWQAPGFNEGAFSPRNTINKNGFTADWTVLHFNRKITPTWIDNSLEYQMEESAFGVNLIDTVDHYQQNERSAKYAFMFIVLTFLVFFFVEIFTKKRIHPVQYLLVGIALILFYSLLLSISEQVNFAIAYIIATFATISLIVGYANSIFKNLKHTGTLAGILVILYTFLYVILQLEDVALLIGSIGLFMVLGIIMYLSKKISWYKEEKVEDIDKI